MRSLLLKFTLLTVAAAMTLTAADPVLGTWKLNVAKSKYDPGPAPKSLTTNYTADGDWIVLKVDGVGADGKPYAVTNKYRRDGKDYPYTNPSFGSGTIAVKAADPHHTSATYKRDGKVVGTSQGVISKDGKVRTLSTEGTNTQGKKFKNVVVYDKQ